MSSSTTAVAAADAPAESPIKARARVSHLVESLEREVLNRNGKAVRLLVESLRQELGTATPAAALEAGALQALLGALNHGWKDTHITESVFQAMVALSTKRVMPSSASQVTVSAAALVRLDGILLLIRVGGEYKANLKMRALVVSLLRNFSVDEYGARLTLWAGAVPVLIESLEAADRLLVIAACTALVSINMFHLSARQATIRGVEALLIATKRFKTDGEILEQTMACLCLLSQSRLGAMTILTFSPTSKPSSNAFSEAAALAIDAQKHLDPASQSEVVVATDRRACAWAMMLLHNLALFGDQVLKMDLYSSFEALNPGRRELGARVLDRMRIMIEESNSVLDAIVIEEETISTDPVVLARSLVKKVADGEGEGEDNDVVCFAVLFSLECLQLPYHLLLDAARLLLEECLQPSTSTRRGGGGVMPVTPPAARLIAMTHAILTHPLLKRGFSPGTPNGSSPLQVSGHGDAIASCKSLIEVIKSSDPPEYFRNVARSLELCLSNLGFQELFLPYRRFPLVYQALPTPQAASPAPSPVKPAKPLSILASPSPATPPPQPPVLPLTSPSGPEDALLWDASPEELVRQLTLRMERLYLAVDPRLVFKNSDAVPLRKFLAYHADLVDFFQARVLTHPTPLARAKAMEGLIKIAANAATTQVSNLDLTMAVIEALQRPALKRLACSWRHVSRSEADRIDELIKLTVVVEGLPPPILRCPSVPFVGGCLDALPALSLDTLVQHYRIASAWLPLLGRSGDWYAKPHAYSLDPSLQMHLAKLERPVNFDAPQLSAQVEPDWAQSQLVVECEAQVKALVERLVGGDDHSKEHALLKRFRALPVEHLTAIEAGKVCRDLVSMLLERKTQFLDQTGVRTEVIWDTLAKRIRLSVETMVLADCYGSLLLAAMRTCEEKELQLGTRIAALRASSLQVQSKFLGVDSVNAEEWLPAVEALNALNHVQTPTLVLDILLRVKDALFAGAKKLGMNEMSADDFLPVLALIVIRANLQSPWSTCALVQDLLASDEIDQGEKGYYFVSLTMAYNLISSFNADLFSAQQPPSKDAVATEVPSNDRDLISL